MVHALSMRDTCVEYASIMRQSCVIHALFMRYSCVIQALFMSSPCIYDPLAASVDAHEESLHDDSYSGVCEDNSPQICGVRTLDPEYAWGEHLQQSSTDDDVRIHHSHHGRCHSEHYF